MATWTPKTKNTSSFVNKNITGIASWAGNVALWGDIVFNWGGAKTQFTNEAKSSSTFVNETKN